MTEAAPQCSHHASHLETENAELQRRLDFVEELLGPTEAQRKELQEQVIAARSAALRAKYRGVGLPTKVAGRLNEQLLWACGLSERDSGLLQGGCLPDTDGILQDVSLLGDPNFHPYDEQTGELRWHARGGMLQLSLGEVRTHFGEEVAHEVVRCARELDQWDSSRRVGIEVPWHPVEDRELQPAEVIDLMSKELSLQSSLLHLDDPVVPYVEIASPDQLSPYAVANALPRRARGRRIRGRPNLGRNSARANPASATGHASYSAQVRYGSAEMATPSSGGASMGSAAHQHNSAGNSRHGGSSGGPRPPMSSSNVVPLPPVEATRRTPDARCAVPNHLRHRMREALDHALLTCDDRMQLF